MSNEINLNNAILLINKKSFEEAIILLDKILIKSPNNIEALNLKSISKIKLNKYSEAINLLNQAIKIDSNNHHLFDNLGLLYFEKKNYSKSLSFFNRSLEIKKDNKNILHTVAIINVKTRNFIEAIKNVNEAIKIDKKFALAIATKANIYKEIGKYNESIIYYKKSLNLDKNNKETLFNLSLPQLIQGDLANGLKNYEMRWFVLRKNRYLHKKICRWNGESLKNKKLLIWAEQGLGDTIHFARYIDYFKNYRENIYFEVQPKLKNLISSSFNSNVSEFNEIKREYDFQIPLLSLISFFVSSKKSIKKQGRYIQSNPLLVKKWKKKFKKINKKKIGIIWKGFIDKRSIPLEIFKGIFNKDFQFISLQYEISDLEKKILRKNSVIIYSKSFDETAGIIENLDLIISVDTSLCHLSGALGQPVWILLSKVSDWRWFQDKEKTKWYKSAKLFRQKKLNEWTEVISNVKNDLKNLYTN